MRILEAMGSKLKEQFLDKLGIAVDFKGSTSGKWCGSRIRFASSAAETLEGAEDFTVSDGCFLARNAAFREKDHAQQQRMCIENSFWFSFWRGKVSGALAQTQISSKGVHQPSGQAMREAQGLVTASASGDAAASDPVRVVVAVSIDGGPITQAEKVAIPGVCQSVMADLRRRGFRWASKAHVVWCHFPSVAELVRSVAGERNLTHDHESERIAEDLLGNPTSFRCVRTTFGRSPVASLLTCSCEEALVCHGNNSADNLITAVVDGDVETVLFLASDKADVNCTDRTSGRSALMLAALHGHTEVVQALVKLRVDVLASGCDGETALTYAVRLHKPQMVQVLLDAKADAKQHMCCSNPISLLHHVKTRIQLLCTQGDQAAVDELCSISALLCRSGADDVSAAGDDACGSDEAVKDAISVTSCCDDIRGVYNLMTKPHKEYPAYLNIRTGVFLSHALGTNEWIFSQSLGDHFGALRKVRSSALSPLSIKAASWRDANDDQQFDCKVLDCPWNDGGFVDEEFSPANEGTLGTRVEGNMTWARAPQMRITFSAALFGDIRPTSIKQGPIGNPGLLAALACLSKTPVLCEQLITPKVLSPNCKYTVRMYDPAMKSLESIVVDDFIPCGRSGPWFRRSTSSKSTASTSNNFWPMIVEKALAKFLGSFEELQGSIPEINFMNLTGLNEGKRYDHSGGSWMLLRAVPTSRKEASFYRVEEGLSADSVWKGLHDALISGGLASMNTPAMLHDSSALNGLIEGQAYALLDAMEVSVNDTKIRLLRLYNPWGIDCAGCWNGPWGKGSDTWTEHPEVIGELQKKGNTWDEDGEGLFWMPFDEASLFDASFSFVCSDCASGIAP
eukprot:TRINITY_DN23689_c0_g2_i1.p1 TRINITY_DN23689_c0_g2~~TRINITY_DN23689_c0_g2_i1.p1  ORF type:complete len:877 (-),score=92.40 TRINITY_DN23689_c0_g2_i1:244-2796(-)